MHKLQDESVQIQIRCTINEKLGSTDSTTINIEESWETCKISLLDTLKEVCGTKKTRGRNRKATAWWNKEVKDAIREKKRLYQMKRITSSIDKQEDTVQKL